MKRRVPRPSELAPLIGFKRPQVNGTQRRLESALTIGDLRRIAKRRTPKAAFDYTDGAAEEELSLARARQAFLDIEFHPTILRNVEKVDTGRTVLGDHVALPFGIAPTGSTRHGQRARVPLLPLAEQRRYGVAFRELQAAADAARAAAERAEELQRIGGVGLVEGWLAPTEGPDELRP